MASLGDTKLLELKVAQMYVFQISEKRILESEKGSTAKSQKTIQMVGNYDPFIKPHAESIDLKLGQISNPYEIFSAAPVRSLGECSSLTRLQAWGPPEKRIPEVSANSRKSQEAMGKHFNAPEDLRGRPCGPIDKGSLSSYRRKDLEQIADDLVSIWGA